MKNKTEAPRSINSKEHLKGLMLAENRRIKDIEEDLKDRKYHLSNLRRQHIAADH